MKNLQGNRTVSVIIPIFNAEKFLIHLFQALSQCDFMEGDEVLLVDNGSTDNSIKICQNEAQKRPELYRCLSFAEIAGSYAARNFAVKQAKGEILIFTDSDCKPTVQWLSAIRNNVKSGVVVAGKVQIEIVNNGLWEHFDTIAHLNSERSAANNRVATANMAVLKEDFFRVGLFEERFSGGDYDWSMKAAKSGLRICFVPEALVYHPSRKTFAEVLKKDQRIAFGAGDHYRICKKSFLILVLKYFFKIFKFDTNVRYSKALKKAGMGRKELCEFQIKFIRIRVDQLRFAIKGYMQSDARKIGIK